MFKLYLPSQNLGCFGLKLGRIYCDFYKWNEGKSIGFFMNWFGRTYYITSRGISRR